MTLTMVIQGQELFTSKGQCYRCHEKNGAGSPLGPNLTDSQWLHMPKWSYEKEVQIITQGVPNPIKHPVPMPAMGGVKLTPEEIQALAAFVYSLSASVGPEGGP